MEEKTLAQLISEAEADIEQYKGVQKRYGSGRWAQSIVESMERKVAYLESLKAREVS